MRRLKIQKRNRLEQDVTLNGEMFDETDDFKEPDTWTIITAMNRILELAEDSRLSDNFWKKCKNPLAFLREKLGLTDIQIVVLAIMTEAGEAMSWKGIGNYLNCTRLSIMV